MNIILTALGSAGDVHPIVGLGLALHERGHEVTIVASAYFEEMVRRTGLEFEPVLSVERFRELMRNPDLWHPTRGIQTVVREGVVPMLRPVYEIIAKRYVPGQTVVGAHSIDFASRIAQDKLGVPVATVHLAPAVFRSVYRAPHLPPLLLGQMVPKWLKRFQYWLADVAVIDPILAGPINALRTELGLPPVRRIFDRWWYSPQRVVGLFPDWYGPPQPDWPRQTVLTGFPLWDESPVSANPDGLEAFLAAGDPPIVFTPGSANLYGHVFFREAVEACRRLGRRGVLLTRHPEQLPEALPEGVRHFDFVPLSWLLPRSAALVHHGGIGTLAQGLAAGVPHLVAPMTHDQPDNARRLCRLGVAEVIGSRRFRAAPVARALARLLASPEVKSRCREHAARIDPAAALARTCEVFEALGEKAAPRAH